MQKLPRIKRVYKGRKEIMPPVVITHNDEQIEPAVREALDHLEIEPMVPGYRTGYDTFYEDYPVV
jgi:hypothetical protein